MFTYTSWVDEKINIAQAMEGGAFGGGYDEGALIVCATISAMSAIAWPGKDIDQKRFVEILAKVALTGRNLNPLKVSIPLLCQEELFLKSILLSSKSFYLTEANDKDFSELVNFLNLKNIVIDNAQIKTIKHNSYGFLLYNQVRCGFAHEYQIGQNATSFDQLRDLANVNKTDVSYTQSLDRNNSMHRRIHFPLSWISCLSRNVAQWLDGERTKMSKQIFEIIDLPRPTNWWIS